ncbi:phosphatase PAP2 family protein [uncultured Desulfovibrio sp.]|uniref:acid phosphatase n=1 Tax=uncultured Desulfovibrio sp. TaxID=167968 RepID=UPI00262017AE|nr:phosphatase PAP2 family protein [uncultured Desulfovibrio sp.]
MLRHFALALALALAPLFAAETAPADTAPHQDAPALAEALRADAAASRDNTAFLPPPPETGSPHFLYDEAMYREGLSLRDTERGRQAARDATAGMPEVFSEAFGCVLSEENTPEILALLARLRGKAGGLSVKEAKKKYARVRPYVFYNAGTCLPGQEKRKRAGASYPSGHSTKGWATALVLAEINPQRREQIMRRGYEFGQSRVICGYHWQSDVDAGRLVGAAAVAFLHADAGFQAQLHKAKEEFARLQREGRVAQ